MPTTQNEDTLLEILNSDEMEAMLAEVPAVQKLRGLEGLSHTQLTGITAYHEGGRCLHFESIASEEFYANTKKFLSTIGFTQIQQNECFDETNTSYKPYCKPYEIRIKEGPVNWIFIRVYNPQFDPVAAGWTNDKSS